MARKTGVPSLLLAAEKVCRLISDWGPTIKNLHPTNDALGTAIDTALAACNTLQSELEAVREYGD